MRTQSRKSQCDMLPVARWAELLRERAAALMDAGLLPLCDGGPVLAGYGSSTECSLCHAHISPAHLYYKVLPWDGVSPAMHLHVECFLAWEHVSYATGAEQA